MIKRLLKRAWEERHVWFFIFGWAAGRSYPDPPVEIDRTILGYTVWVAAAVVVVWLVAWWLLVMRRR